MKILIGSNNAHKAQEIRDLLPEFEIVCPKDIGLELDVEENGKTFEDNAMIKARAFAEASGMLTLADDSGLEVDCLNGKPGIYSARYSPKPGADDRDRRLYLLENIRKAGTARPWTARFRCVIAVVFPGGNMRLSASGTCEGEIIPEERGSGGFGYDPVFYMPDKGMTLSEMSEEEKNAVSHRGNAIRKAAPMLLAYAKGQEEGEA